MDVDLQCPPLGHVHLAQRFKSFRDHESLIRAQAPERPRDQENQSAEIPRKPRTGFGVNHHRSSCNTNLDFLVLTTGQYASCKGKNDQIRSSGSCITGIPCGES